MTPRLNITGVWPSPITISGGWSRASARPWCDEPDTALLRLLRGSAGFLAEATGHLIGLGAHTVLSPPLYRSATSVWRKSGYHERHRLQIMERPLGLTTKKPEISITRTTTPPWPQVVDLDHRAFHGMWRMSETGLKEAFAATGTATVLLAGEGSRIEGYALVGSHWGISYLHRIAVEPSRRGEGIGTELVRAALTWARGTLSRVIVLNVRPANEGARRLYEREGFTPTGHDLHLLGYDA